MARRSPLRDTMGRAGEISEGRLSKSLAEGEGLARTADDVAKLGEDLSGNSQVTSRRGLARLGEEVEPTPKTYEQSLNPDLWLRDVADKHGINLRGSGESITVKYDSTLSPSELGMTYWDEGGRVTRIGPTGMATEASAANTIAHELSHARDYIRARNAGMRTILEAEQGGFIKPHGDESSLGSGSAYGSGNALEAWIRGKR